MKIYNPIPSIKFNEKLNTPLILTPNVHADSLIDSVRKA